MARDLRDLVIAITGGGTGIGAATARACARAGMHVAVGGRRLDKLQGVAADVRAMDRRALAACCDVDRDEDVRRFIDATLAELGRLDVLFANAGYGLFCPISCTSLAEARAIFETNFYGTLRAVHAALPVMRRQGGGHIVICSSAAAPITPPFYGLYGATKAAQRSIAQALRAELADESIAVTTVFPIGTRTDFFDAVRTGASAPGGRDETHGGTPAWMLQSVDHVAARVVRSLRRPRAEVWPSPLTRVGIALGMMMPGMTAKALVKHVRKRKAGQPSPSPAAEQGT